MSVSGAPDAIVLAGGSPVVQRLSGCGHVQRDLYFTAKRCAVYVQTIGGCAVCFEHGHLRTFMRGAVKRLLARDAIVLEEIMGCRPWKRVVVRDE